MYAYQVLDTNGKEVFPIMAEQDEEILRKVVRKNIRQTTFDGEKGSIKFFSESRKKTDKGTTIVTLTLLPKEKRHRTVSSRVQIVTDISKL